MKKLYIFTTYWNERDWIDASLEQIDELSPNNVIIVDGCYDPRYENCSTDGTREKIKTWVATHNNAEMISALRLSRINALWLLFGHGLNWWNWPLRILLGAYYFRTNNYRLNQAATFTKMLRQSGIKPGEWFMTYDADQFYSDETITNIKAVINSETNAQLLTATERTFFTNFNEMTTEYEARDYNNLPHRYSEQTLIVPTRDIVREQYPKPKVYGKDASLPKQIVGTYNHYKFRPHATERTAAGYQVGDRKQPNIQQFVTQPFTEPHPQVIKNYFADELTDA